MTEIDIIKNLARSIDTQKYPFQIPNAFIYSWECDYWVMTQEAETKFHEIGCEAFIQIFRLTDEEKKVFFDYVTNKKPCVFDQKGYAQAYILDTIDLFENNPDLYTKKVEQATQLKLL